MPNYTKITLPGKKLYFGVINGKTLRRPCRTATMAQVYARMVEQRLARLTETYWTMRHNEMTAMRQEINAN